MPDDQEKVQEGGGKGRKRSVLIGIFVTVLMLGEGLGIYLAMRMFEPQPVDAAKLGGMKNPDGDSPYGNLVEVLVGEFKAPWSKSGRTFLFEVSVAVRVSDKAKETVSKKLADNQSLISDRIVRIIRSAELHQLEEDGLETIRRQIKYALDSIVGDETAIVEVLIPRYIKFRADY